MVDQYVPGLKRYHAIAHNFEIYEGDHGNRITARFAAKVLPFFSEHLAMGK